MKVCIKSKASHEYRFKNFNTLKRGSYRFGNNFGLALVEAASDCIWSYRPKSECEIAYMVDKFARPAIEAVNWVYGKRFSDNW